jgi:hypothetical protein
MIMLPFGAQVTGKRESLLENHVLNRKDTLISDFPLLVVRIHPAARQALTGKKYHVGLAKAGRVRHFLARVEPALEFIPERIKERFEVHDLHDIAARNMPQKHGSSFTSEIPRVQEYWRLLDAAKQSVRHRQPP